MSDKTQQSGDRGTGDTGRIWRHLNDSDGTARSAIEDVFALAPTTIDALLTEDARPRYFRDNSDVVFVCRGINTNPNEYPEDMVSLRMWCDGKNIITVERREVAVVDDLQGSIDRGDWAPARASDVFLRLVDRLMMRLRQNIRELERECDELEDESLDGADAAFREKLKSTRRKIIWLIRFVEPQSEAFEELLDDPPAWMTKHQLAKTREISDITLRFVETLQAIREQTMVLQDHLSMQADESMKQMTYLLTMAAAIFLPLNLVAGLMGANVGGIPGAHHPFGFIFLCVVVAAIAIGGYWALRRLK